MNYLDIIIAIPLIYGFVKGFENGLIKEITGIIGIFFGLYIAIHFSPYLYPKATNFFGDQKQFIPIISFTTLFVVSFITIKVLGYVIDKFSRVLALGFLSRLLGAVFGALKIIVILSFLTLLINRYEIIQTKIKKESKLIIPLEFVAKIIIPEINRHKEVFLEKTKEKTEKVKKTLDVKIYSE
tara:strand:+ start:52 stop:600 length:549 start_codon:yes stop_codon:yes gene_type:complete